MSEDFNSIVVGLLLMFAVSLLSTSAFYFINKIAEYLR